MITLVERQIDLSSADSPLVGMYQFAEDGDTLIVTPSIPFLGLSQINTAPVIHKECHFGAELEVHVKYSLDEGLTWSEDKLLSELVFPISSFKSNHVSLFEFTLIQRGNGVIFFYGIDFDSQENSLVTTQPSIPQIYQEIEDSIPYYNHDSLKWSLNVLDKVYKDGILPKFIKRGNNENWEDEDFINFWWALIYPMSLRIAMAEKFVDLLWNPNLLKEYLKQRGIVVGNTTNLIELYHLMYYFYDEVARRGSLSVLDSERPVAEGETIRGPIARLIELQNPSDLNFKFINSWEIGWFLGMSSPCGYAISDVFMNYGIAYENETFLSKDHYPLSEPAGSSILILNQPVEEKDKDILSISLTTPSVFAGIGNKEDHDLDMTGPKVPVSVHKDYVVEVYFNPLLYAGKYEVYFGCHGYDSEGNQISPWWDGSDSQDTFFNDDEYGLSFVGNKPYKLMGIIRNIDFQMPSNEPYYDGYCLQHKIIAQNLAYIEPYFGCKRSVSDSTTTWLDVYDFRVYELKDEYTFIDSITQKISKMSIANHNFSLTKEEIKKIIKNRLLPFEEANSEITFE